MKSTSSYLNGFWMNDFTCISGANLLKMGFMWSEIELTQGHCIFFENKHFVGEVWSRLDHIESRYALDNDFSNISTTTSTSDVDGSRSLHTLIKSSVFIKYEQKRVSWEYKCSKKGCFDMPLTYKLYLRSLHIFGQ